MIEQRSPEWYARRLGKVGASRIADLTARTKTGWGASRGNLMAQLITERLTGVPGDTYVSPAMQWGIDTEGAGKAAYAFRTDHTVEPCEFFDHPSVPMSGASPDGLVGEDGLIELKCPMSATHIETLLGQAMPSKYVAQVQWQMAVTGRQWVDFVSYDPRLPESMCVFIQRVHRDANHIRELENEVRTFLSELDAKLAKLVERYERREAA